MFLTIKMAPWLNFEVFFPAKSFIVLAASCKQAYVDKISTVRYTIQGSIQVTIQKQQKMKEEA